MLNMEWEEQAEVPSEDTLVYVGALYHGFAILYLDSTTNVLWKTVHSTAHPRWFKGKVT